MGTAWRAARVVWREPFVVHNYLLNKLVMKNFNNVIISILTRKILHFDTVKPPNVSLTQQTACHWLRRMVAQDGRARWPR